jgi:hypothetical protein
VSYRLRAVVGPPRKPQVAAFTIPASLVTRAISLAASAPSGTNMSTRLGEDEIEAAV